MAVMDALFLVTIRCIADRPPFSEEKGALH
jgi:hypothetical protein